MTHSGFHVRKLAVRLANSLSEVRKEEEGLGRSKTHLIGPIRALASLLHPQFFILVLFNSSAYNTEQHDCSGRGLD